MFGHLSDQIGRRPVVLASLVAAAVSAGAFLFARSTAWLFAARMASGVSIALASGAVTAFGYRCGLEVVNAISPPDERSQMVSSYLVVCYVAISLPVIGVGFVSRQLGAMLADGLFGAACVLLAVAALAFESRRALQASGDARPGTERQHAWSREA